MQVSHRCTWRAASARPARHRQHAVSVHAYAPDASELKTAALCVPTPFVSTPKKQCPAQLLQREAQYHGSQWMNDLVLSSSDGDDTDPATAFTSAVDLWQRVYTPLQQHTLAVAADPSSHSAFMLFAADLVNTGSFAGAQPTMKRSGVMGVYRMTLDDDGHLQDVWCYRGGTAEEQQYLLKPEALPPQQAEGGSAEVRSAGPHAAAAPPPHTATSRMVEEVTAAWPALAPCTWSADPAYVATMVQRAATWSQEVMSKGCLTSLLEVAAPDITVWDGTGLQHDTLKGVEAVGHHLVRTVTAWDMSPRAAACSAVDPGSNKLFVHWSQTGSPRQGGGSDVAHTGVSVLVFNAQARIQQVLDFVELNAVQRSALLREEVRGASAAQQQQVLSSWYASLDLGAAAGSGQHARGGSGGTDKAAAAAAAAAAEAEAAAAEARHQAECLARQDAEWMSW